MHGTLTHRDALHCDAKSNEIKAPELILSPPHPEQFNVGREMVIHGGPTGARLCWKSRAHPTLNRGARGYKRGIYFALPGILRISL